MKFYKYKHGFNLSKIPSHILSPLKFFSLIFSTSIQYIPTTRKSRRDLAEPTDRSDLKTFQTYSTADPKQLQSGVIARVQRSAELWRTLTMEVSLSA